jgi:hypothetical protein
LIVNNLTDKANGRLGAISIKLRHVHVIHEEDEDLASRGAENATSSLVNVTFKNLLEGLRICVIVEIQSSSHGVIHVAIIEVILKNNSFTSTSITNEHHTLLGSAMDFDKELLASSFGSGYNKVVEKTIVSSVKLLATISPSSPVEL